MPCGRPCHYCGGMHLPSECPMMNVPAMPGFMDPGMMMPDYNMGPGMMMPGMGNWNPCMPPMPMPPAPCPEVPVPLPTPIPDELLAGIADMIMNNQQTLDHISLTVDQIYEICKAMQLGMAKG